MILAGRCFRKVSVMGVRIGTLCPVWDTFLGQDIPFQDRLVVIDYLWALKING